MSGYVKKRQAFERGMVSLFVVIFSSLLLTVLSIGFIRLMIQEQQSASNNDLSRSAYDSAVAGVEDGKRVLKKCADGSDVACQAIAAKECTTVTKAEVITSQPDEIKIRSNASTDVSMNQAYTCVKITGNTDDVLVNLKEGESMVVPLKAVSEFNKIRVSWMHKETGENQYYGATAVDLEPPTPDSDYTSLPKKSAWNPLAASLLRVQTVLPPSGSFASAAEFDSAAVSTRFLRPANVRSDLLPENGFSIKPVAIGLPRAAGSEDARLPLGTNPIACSLPTYRAGDYGCRAVLESQDEAGQGLMIAGGSNMAFIRLTSLYRPTSVRLEMLDRSDKVVQFDGVQPEIDSTGRASNVFRRIASRVSLSMGSTAYPEYAVDTTDSLCKDFYVTASSAGSRTNCQP